MGNMDFNYVHILRLLYSTDELVQLLAGELTLPMKHCN